MMRIMFIVTYSYRVPKNKINKFLDIERRARKVYFRHGCVEYEIFKSDNDWCFEINRFKSREQYESVKKSVDADPEIEILWKEFCTIIDKEKIITQKYERILPSW